MDLLAFKVVIEPDEDAWASYYPAWINLGASTWGETQEAAAVNIKEVLEMLIEEIEEGQIEWPIEPHVPNLETSKRSIQDAPEFVQLNCAPEHPDAIASHGGLPMSDTAFGNDADGCYRLIYLAVNQNPWCMAWTESFPERHIIMPPPALTWLSVAGYAIDMAPQVSLSAAIGSWGTSGWNAGTSRIPTVYTTRNGD